MKRYSVGVVFGMAGVLAVPVGLLCYLAAFASKSGERLVGPGDLAVLGGLASGGAALGVLATAVSRRDDWRVLATVLLPSLVVPIVSSGGLWMILKLAPSVNQEGVVPLDFRTTPADGLWAALLLLPASIPVTHFLLHRQGRTPTQPSRAMARDPLGR